MSQAREKFVALDGLRGVGAICVLLAHIVYNEKIPLIFANASPGVDFFFVLSGFVITHAYEKALHTTMGWWRYFRVRMIRLYPTIAIGGLLGFAVAAMIGSVLRCDLGFALALQMLLIPMFGCGADIFPLNGAHWSLFFELAANFLHGALAKWVSEFHLWAVLALSFAALVWSALEFGSLGVGWATYNFVGGFARVSYSFTLGLLFYRLHSSGRLRAPKVPVIWIMAALVIGMATPAPPGPYGLIGHDLIAVAIVFPAFVLFAANAEAPARLEPVLAWLGVVSYPLYALHVPLLRLFGRPLVSPDVPHIVKAAGWSFVIVACVLIAWLTAKFVDAPVRAWLSQVSRNWFERRVARGAPP